MGPIILISLLLSNEPLEGETGTYTGTIASFETMEECEQGRNFIVDVLGAQPAPKQVIVCHQLDGID